MSETEQEDREFYVLELVRYYFTFHVFILVLMRCAFWLISGLYAWLKERQALKEEKERFPEFHGREEHGE